VKGIGSESCPMVDSIMNRIEALNPTSNV